MQVGLRYAFFLFIAYNLFLASVLTLPLTAPASSSESSVSFSDSDFGPATPPPYPVRISKPFYEAAGETLTFNFEEYGTNNVTGLPVNYVVCAWCNMLIVALPLAPPPAFATNGTILSGPYNVTRSAHYVLIYDTRSYSSCSFIANCTLHLSGTVIASTPVGPSPYSNLPTALTILGMVAVLPPFYWTLRKQRRQRLKVGDPGQ